MLPFPDIFGSVHLSVAASVTVHLTENQLERGRFLPLRYVEESNRRAMETSLEAYPHSTALPPTVKPLPADTDARLISGVQPCKE